MNSLALKYLYKVPIVQTFTGAIIKQLQRDVKVALVNRTEIHVLWEKLTQHTVGIPIAVPPANADSDKPEAFSKHYFDTDMKLQNAPETQTGYLLVIAFHLIAPDDRVKAAAHLVRLVNAADNHLRTGFLGTPYIVSVLDEMGYSELAYELLFKETYPSWFYSIDQGATTMWERWDSYSHAEGFSEASMNSFNHYAFGAIGQWMVERVAGLSPDPQQPGYKHFFIQPLPGDPLTWARAEYHTPYGKAVSGWKKTAAGLTIEATVPPNTTATLVIPAADAVPTVTESGQTQKLTRRGDRFEIALTPGVYHFSVTP